MPSFRTKRGRCHVDGETKRRYVTMPSLWLSYGDGEFRRAKETFRNADLVVEE